MSGILQVMTLLTCLLLLLTGGLIGYFLGLVDSYRRQDDDNDIWRIRRK